MPDDPSAKRRAAFAGRDRLKKEVVLETVQRQADGRKGTEAKRLRQRKEADARRESERKEQQKREADRKAAQQKKPGYCPG